MNLKIIALSEIRQVKKSTYCVIPFLYKSGKMQNKLH